MLRINNLYEVTKRLCGLIEPQGDSSIDKVRFQNLEDTIQLVERLLEDIIYVARFKEDNRNSMKVAGMEADKFLTMLKEKLND